MIKPPSAGPTIVATWKIVLFQATALLNCSGGTIHGKQGRARGRAEGLPHGIHDQQQIDPAERKRDSSMPGSARRRSVAVRPSVDGQHQAAIDAVGQLSAGNGQQHHRQGLHQPQPSQGQHVCWSGHRR